jgi:hypothetical protein
MESGSKKNAVFPVLISEGKSEKRRSARFIPFPYAGMIQIRFSGYRLSPT